VKAPSSKVIWDISAAWLIFAGIFGANGAKAACEKQRWGFTMQK
jgi:hypothetical protein